MFKTNMAILWFRIKAFFSKKTKVIETPKIQITATGKEPVTDERREQYLKETKKCIEDRIREYPSWEEIIEALADAESGDKTKLQVVIRKRRLTKLKYPKPKEI
jgi:hypothetical protein